ncbi:MAG: heavy metal translocating P-type ATPase, partial [Planctomycetota bacterium]
PEGIRFVMALLGSILVMPLSMGWISFSAGKEVTMILATLVVLGAGSSFFRNALLRLRHGMADMDTLIALGSGTALAYSHYAYWTGHGHLYFDSAVMIITFILLGRLLEKRALLHSGETMKSLLAQKPQKARRILTDGTEEEIPVEAVEKGDLLLVKPGEKVPVDCLIKEGEGYVDESMFTGEPLPVPKGTGDTLKGGSISQDGAFQVEALGRAEESYIQKIISLVEDAQTSKAPVQRIADKVAAVFVPLVLLVGVLAFGIHYFLLSATLESSIIPAISVLLIACPCTLGLATPVAITIALGKAAQFGLVCRNAATIEVLTQVNLVAFDKTGTLTLGEPKVEWIYTSSRLDSEDQALFYAASLESLSEHPLGKAFLDKASHLSLEKPKDFQYFPGKGIRGKIQETEILLGSKAFLKEEKIEEEPKLRENEELLRQQGATILYLAVSGHEAALFGLIDTIKEDGPQTIQNLKKIGLQIAMLTGDTEESALYVAQKLDIDKSLVFYSLLPHEKLERIQELKKNGTVAMVGDGVNDGPSLAAAHIGIAMGKGTEVAMESAPVVLLTHELMGVYRIFALARKTMQIIYSNLFFAFFYNTLAIPIAAAGYLHPMMAALAMALSSVSVVSNSNRLRYYKA